MPIISNLGMRESMSLNSSDIKKLISEYDEEINSSKLYETDRFLIIYKLKSLPKKRQPQ
jgi:hypothetical protein